MLNVEFKSDEVSDFHLKISQNIKRIRKQAGITQLNLAVGIGINSSGSYSDYENNKNSKKFNLNYLYKIAKVLEVDVCEFFI
ncbi:XRE family transcriptional regulator [Isorropodon fossajaponicum endosymbiont JTNG4]|uniref:helix-turn-helix domain-containing protein n=1 Tax=Isorropodon fossajaponicum symbiont TaxID=883811 RepID=UPI0019157B86|nr:helix-turn-helix transcriptional regulator [Isorropodon fossajaponicum symbiont]BBB23673.1 XRE family transcriptional regulator [Isorropodon fossajaponicum endosymbiont JTNG4]